VDFKAAVPPQPYVACDCRSTDTARVECVRLAASRPRLSGANVSGAHCRHSRPAFRPQRLPGGPARPVARIRAWCCPRPARPVADRPSRQHPRKWLPGPAGSVVRLSEREP